MSNTTFYPVSYVPARLARQAEAPPNIAGVSRRSIYESVNRREEHFHLARPFQRSHQARDTAKS